MFGTARIRTRDSIAVSYNADHYSNGYNEVQGNVPLYILVQKPTATPEIWTQHTCFAHYCSSQNCLQLRNPYDEFIPNCQPPASLVITR